MSNDVIELTQENYKNFLPIDVLAFSFAKPGAMGSPGEIIIINNKSAVYSFNISNFESVLIKEIIPIFFECKFGLFGHDILPTGWSSVYLGAGNHLILHDTISVEFARRVRECMSGSNNWSLYKNWISVVAAIISSENDYTS